MGFAVRANGDLLVAVQVAVVSADVAVMDWVLVFHDLIPVELMEPHV